VNPDNLLTINEVCALLRISPQALQSLRMRRKIAYVHFGHKTIRFHEQAVRDFLKRREKAVLAARSVYFPATGKMANGSLARKEETL